MFHLQKILYCQTQIKNESGEKKENDSETNIFCDSKW